MTPPALYFAQLENVEGVIDSSAVMQSALDAVSKQSSGTAAQNAHVIDRVSKKEQRKVLPLLTSAKVRRKLIFRGPFGRNVKN